MFSRAGLSATLFLFTLPVLTTGCAAAFRGSRATISVESTPPGATVELRGNTLGKTPGEVRVPRQGSSLVSVSKEGFETAHFNLDRSLNAGWAVWDILTCVVPVTLCIPLLVDGITGAWVDVEGEYVVSMPPVHGSSTAGTVAGTPSSTAP